MATRAITYDALSEYELLRQKQILVNENFLKSLQITDIIDDINSSTQETSKKRKKNKTISSASRKSSRIDKSENSNEQKIEFSFKNNDAYCRLNSISFLDLKQYINQHYSDKRINHRV
jgi:hypothetical protein